jgi:hypothetical protein
MRSGERFKAVDAIRYPAERAPRIRQKAETGMPSLGSWLICQGVGVVARSGWRRS